MVSPTLRRIAALSEERRRLYALAGERWLTDAERERLACITAALALVWEQRRAELAQCPVVDHELVVVGALRERAVGR
ncbi:MAG: hypothetical protein IPO81_19215 [Kouleothrix sp.]|nr:hypothetical protein [Kouleothrix sp.]